MTAPGMTPALLECTILVVDDDLGVRSIVRRMLEFAGATVLEADGGEVALRTVQNDGATGRLDAVVTDLEMPGVHGNEVIAVLRDCCPDLPVLAMSGHSHAAAGLAVPFIGKPFAERELVDRVGEMVRAARPMRQRARQQSADAAESRTNAGRQLATSASQRVRTQDFMAALQRLRDRLWSRPG